MPDNTPLTDAALAELDRLHKQYETSWLAIGHDLHNAYLALRQRLDAAEFKLSIQTASASMRGRSLLEAYKQIEGLQTRLAEAERERDEAEAHVADLRGALEQVDKLAVAHSPQMAGKVSLRMMHAVMSEALHGVKAALSRTPAQSLARVKAEVLREAAKIIDRSRANTPYAFGGYSAADAERALLMEADRLEKEAANGR